MLIARRLEKSFPIEPNQPRAEVWLDYKLVAASVLIPYVLSSATAFSSSAILSAAGGGFFHLRADGWWLAPSLVVYILAADLYRYWMHRLSHMIPALWQIHSFHHSAEAVTFVTGARHHWLDRVLNDAFFPFFPIVFQTPPEIVLIGNFIYFLPDGCAHLNVKFSLGRFVMWINSPQYHRIHHSTQPEHFNKNFAPLLPLWDIVFGTAWRPAKDEFPSTGLAGGEKPRTVWEGVVWPFRILFRSKTSERQSAFRSVDWATSNALVCVTARDGAAAGADAGEPSARRGNGP
ncbi:sterol desaturase family protein [Aliidongia dinghuensis]|uniref:sterol desaturase family protein n=1 Tax=Aliidongia dinghuensis TaxID=1867774 RepID=UPI00166A2043|nr:sterol desaturase family protein [Aliidongia dinghuensis]